MFDEQDGYVLNDLGRRLANIIRIGTIYEIDFSKAKARVKIGELETDFLPWVNSNSGNNNSWNPPEIDEQVVVLSPSGELNQAVILPSLYKNNASDDKQTIQSVTYEDGSKVTFDKMSGSLILDLQGDLNLNIKGAAAIKVTGNAEIEAANVSLKGNIDLGDAGGKGVARIGDEVEITGGSSAGKWPIISGSSKVKVI